MLTLSLQADDLARIRFAPSALDHLVLGSTPGAGLTARSAAQRRWWCTARRNVPYQALPFLELIRIDPYYLPDFLAVASTSRSASPNVSSSPASSASSSGWRSEARPSIIEQLEVVAATPEQQIIVDLDPYGPDVPAVVRELRDGGTKRLRRLVSGIWKMYNQCLADDWESVRLAAMADISHQGRVMTSQGPLQAVNSLCPRLLFRPADAAGSFGGRGAVISPNIFLGEFPFYSIPPDPDSQPIVLYSAGGDAFGSRNGQRDLAELVGRTRAAALRLISAADRTTGELAHLLGVSPSTASGHATALRNAGLITTQRNGMEVLHAPTDLGLALLAASTS